jgi:HKD family nuclease
VAGLVSCCARSCGGLRSCHQCTRACFRRRSIPNALAALESLTVDAESISAAVAFVSDSGVSVLAQILEGRRDINVEIAARAGGITDPDAIIRLRDELGIEVSLVIGRHAAAFRPKLWLVRSTTHLSVLSGSGNLTLGGLVSNVEQFELLQVDPTSDDAGAHEARYDGLTTDAVPLADIHDTAIWHEWLSVLKRQRAHLRELRRLESQLNSREFARSRAADNQRLLEDLDDLYERTVAANLVQHDGRHYVPSRFKQGIERVRNGADPVLFVTRVCRRASDGFNIILDADRRDLTAELLVVDESKPYHDLFSQTSKELSLERLHRFPSWEVAKRRSSAG